MTTLVQGQVSEALQELKFEFAGGKPGSDHELKVTDETLDFLKGKIITIDSEGKVTAN